MVGNLDCAEVGALERPKGRLRKAAITLGSEGRVDLDATFLVDFIGMTFSKLPSARVRRSD
jgi:hypothetical protein